MRASTSLGKCSSSSYIHPLLRDISNFPPAALPVWAIDIFPKNSRGEKEKIFLSSHMVIKLINFSSLTFFSARIMGLKRPWHCCCWCCDDHFSLLSHLSTRWASCVARVNFHISKKFLAFTVLNDQGRFWVEQTVQMGRGEGGGSRKWSSLMVQWIILLPAFFLLFATICQPAMAS